MFPVLLSLTVLIVLASMAVAYARSRDALHPLMFLGPMLIYVYVVRPGLLWAGGDLEVFLSEEQVLFAQTLFSLGIAFFCAGVLWGSGTGRGRVYFRVTPWIRGRLVRLGCFLGTLSVSAYWIGIFQSGGFFGVYSHAKGHWSAGSGWINELVNLSIPAATLLLLAWQGRRRYRNYLLLAILFASPLLIHGILGARRGPTFIILATLLLARLITSGRRITLWETVTGFGVIVLLLFVLIAHRTEIHLGSDVDFSWAKVGERVAPTAVTNADDTVFMYGFVNGVRNTGTHYWGLRYAATYLVRPIPRQLWPTKYEDLGFGWMKNQEDFGGITDEQWEEAIGWVPVRGSAAGFAADLYLEFSYGGILGCCLFGWFFGWLWKKASSRAGMWTLLYIQAAALSIYVPVQGVSAVFHRFLFVAVPIVFLWKSWLGSPVVRRRAYERRALLPPLGKITGGVGSVRIADSR